MTSGASNWNPTKSQVPVKKGLLVQYDPETDILTLWNGTPASNGRPSPKTSWCSMTKRTRRRS